MFSLWDFLFYFEITRPFYYLFPPFGNGKVYFVTLHVESMLKNSIFGKKKNYYIFTKSHSQEFDLSPREDSELTLL